MASKSEIVTFKAHFAAQLVPVKLTEDNYGLWRSLIIPILKDYDMIYTVLGIEQPSPSQTLTDKNCFDFLQRTLSPSMLSYSMGCSSAHALWLKLEEQGWIAQSCLHQVRSRLKNMNKGSFTMESYYQAKRKMADRLNAAGRPLTEADFVKYVLKGLPASYDRFKDSFFAGTNGLCGEELYNLLMAEETDQTDRERRVIIGRITLASGVTLAAFFGLLVAANS